MPHILTSVNFCEARRKAVQAYRSITAIARSNVRQPTAFDRDSATAHEQSQCLLFRLPSELRNYVYELVFATPSVVDLINTCPPRRDLILTCQRICSETSEMYKDRYRSYWRNTLFMIDVFEPCSAQTWIKDINSVKQARDSVFEHGAKSPEHRRLDEDKKLKVYAKIRDIQEADLAQIRNIQILTEGSNQTWTLGDFESGMWTAYAILAGGRSTKLIQYFPHVSNEKALTEAGFEVVAVWSSKTHRQVYIDTLSWDKVMEAKTLIERRGLSKEELMTPLRIAALDFLYDAAQ